MSSRGEKLEKGGGGGSKMLKKAQSFREDIKNKIRRRPSTGVQQMIPEGKSRRSKVDTRERSGEDLENLKAAMDEVNKTLKFINAVVNRGKLEVLPGSASVILETVMTIFTLLRYPQVAQESNSLSSSQSNVCQNLAKFIQWTDTALVKKVETEKTGKQKDGKKVKEVESEKELNKEELEKEKELEKIRAKAVIDTLLEGVKELTKLGMEKINQKNSTSLLPPTPVSPVPSPPAESSDIPLTPREQEILVQTGGAVFDRSSNNSVFSFDSRSSGTESDLCPPPKPPLPQTLARLPIGEDCVDGLIPPPLPDKKRSPSASIDILDSIASRTSPHPSTLISSTSLDHHLGIAMRGNPTSSLNPSSNCDVSRTSSTSSSSSSLQTSNVDGSRVQSFSQTSSDSRQVSASVVSRKTSGRTVEEINQLTTQIKELTSMTGDTPPPLPAKTKAGLTRLNSQYDNVPSDVLTGLQVAQRSSTSTVVMRKTESRISSSSTSSCQSSHSNHSQSVSALSHKSFLTEHNSQSRETFSSSETFSSTSHSSTESLQKPPPLPPKTKHVQAYMQTFGALTQPGLLDEVISRHSITFYEAQWQQHQREMSYPRSNTISVFSDISSGSSVSGSSERVNSMPPLPGKSKRLSDISHDTQLSTGSTQSTQSSSSGDLVSLDTGNGDSVSECSAGETRAANQRHSLPPPASPPVSPPLAELPPLSPPLAQGEEIQKDSDSAFCEQNLLDDVDVADLLVLKAENEEGPEVRGGPVDALIVHATQAGKIGQPPKPNSEVLLYQAVNMALLSLVHKPTVESESIRSQGDITEQEEFMFQEAFLTTYRMFIVPKDLMTKLLYRFHKFQHAQDNKKKLAHNAFSLMIRVVDELGCNELDASIVNRLMALVYDLICQGALNLARLLRRKLIEKCEQKQSELDAKQIEEQAPVSVSSVDLSSSGDLLAFKAHDIAEQMTLLDSQLFQKIEIPEVLMWAREQSEELSPHLTTFTEHFNKMSYWCSSKVLTQEDPKEREKYLIKFIKIMRHLLKLHNFNSYLAILSALNSAAVIRLEWQKQNLEVLGEMCQLIDSSKSFLKYRQTLAETDPPCIPYLGLILQDLTFINIGNQDKLPDGNINFNKHWQQFNILDSMRRFRTGTYQFKRNDKIMGVLNNFKDHLNEESLWNISQKIKPSTHSGHRKQNSIS